MVTSKLKIFYGKFTEITIEKLKYTYLQFFHKN
jgi:hypothetical protein